MDTLYANDDPDKSYAVGTSAIQAHPDLKLFISGSGISRSGDQQGDPGYRPFGPGLRHGLRAAEHDEDLSRQRHLQAVRAVEPVQFGYIATYMAILIKSGKVKPVGGTEVDVPTIGKRTIEPSPTTVNLSAMLFFTKDHPDFDNAIPAQL